MKKNILAKGCALIFIFLFHTIYLKAQPATPVITPYVVACGGTAFNINAVPPLSTQQVRWYNNFYMQTLLYTGNIYSGTATQSQTFYASTYDPGTGLQSPYPATAYVFVPKPPVIHATAGIDPITNCLGAITVKVDTTIDSVTTVPIADDYVRENAPTANYGLDSFMIIWATMYHTTDNSRLYMKFDLTQIPPNVIVTDSRLTMTKDDGFAHGNDGNIYAQFVSDDTWTETGLNWNNKPAIGPMTVNGVSANYMYWVWDNDYGFDGGTYGGTLNWNVQTWTNGVNGTAWSGLSPLGVVDTGILSFTQSEYAGDKIMSVAMESVGYDTRWRTKEYRTSEAQIPHLHVYFGYNSVNSTYSWTGPNGYTSTQESISGLIQGTYTLTVTNAYNCATTTTVSVTNAATTTVVKDTICTGGSYTFAGHIYTISGTYSDTMTSSIGCDSITALHLFVRPVITSTVYDTMCTGSSFNYYGHVYTTAGTYTNSFVTNIGCDSNVTLNLYALPVPTVTATNNSPMCINGTNVLNLSATGSPGVTYSWTGPMGFTSTQQNPQITNLTSGTSGIYFVTVTLPTGCSATGSTNVTISAGPPLPLVYDITYCQYDIAVPLNAIGSNLMWYTSPTGGIGDTVVPVPSTQNVGTTTWYVTQTAPNGCISFRAAISATVNFKARFHIVADSFVCLYDSTGFAYNGTTPPAGAVYTWSTPRTTAITFNNNDSIHVRFDSIGNHEILLAVADDSAGKCESVDSQNIYVAPPPVANFTMPTDGCIGQTINVVVTNGTPDITYTGYTWNFNNANVTSGNTPGPGPYTITYPATGLYQVSLVAISRYGCAATDTVTDTITIHSTPVAFIDSISALSVCTGDTVSVIAGSYDPQNQYEWTPKSAFIVNGNTSRKDSAVIASTTDIYLTVTTPYGCKDSSDDVVTGQSCCGVYFPTAFSPGAGINNKFRPITVGHHKIEVFRIVNRWGQTVYTSDNEEAGWDGTLNGVPQEIGDYFWYIKYQCSNGTMTEEKGTVTLIR